MENGRKYGKTKVVEHQRTWSTPNYCARVQRRREEN